jgi:hypothetical protein
MCIHVSVQCFVLVVGAKPLIHASTRGSSRVSLLVCEGLTYVPARLPTSPRYDTCLSRLLQLQTWSEPHHHRFRVLPALRTSSMTPCLPDDPVQRSYPQVPIKASHIPSSYGEFVEHVHTSSRTQNARHTQCSLTIALSTGVGTCGLAGHPFRSSTHATCEYKPGTGRPSRAGVQMDTAICQPGPEA